MTEPNVDVVIDCADPERLAAFWAEALGYMNAGFFDPYVVLLPPECAHPPVMLQRVPEPKNCEGAYPLRPARARHRSRPLAKDVGDHRATVFSLPTSPPGTNQWSQKPTQPRELHQHRR